MWLVGEEGSDLWFVCVDVFTAVVAVFIGALLEV
jgi:hypothetical protein